MTSSSYRPAHGGYPGRVRRRSLASLVKRRPGARGGILNGAGAQVSVHPTYYTAPANPLTAYEAIATAPCPCGRTAFIRCPCGLGLRA